MTSKKERYFQKNYQRVSEHWNRSGGIGLNDVFAVREAIAYGFVLFFEQLRDLHESLPTPLLPPKRGAR